jgi:hypothetical protein
MYASGEGVPKDYTQALKWYRQAADQGHVVAQHSLGTMYALGQGVPQDFTQAVYWYRKAADQGDAGAQAILGRMYASGEGVPQDYTQTRYWLYKAADQGYARAHWGLGFVYEEGLGVPQDAAQAYFWYNLAAARLPVGTEREQVVQARDRMATRLTSVQQADAQNRASTWQPGQRYTPTPTQQISQVPAPKHCPYPFIDTAKLLPFLLNPSSFSAGSLAGLSPGQITQIMEIANMQEESRRRSVEAIINNALEIQRLRAKYCVGTVD